MPNQNPIHRVIVVLKACHKYNSKIDKNVIVNKSIIELNYFTKFANLK